jgi:hypothetical protein
LLVVTSGTNDTKGYGIKVKSIYRNKTRWNLSKRRGSKHSNWYCKIG